MRSLLARRYAALSSVYNIGTDLGHIQGLQECLLQRLQRYTSQYHYEGGSSHDINTILEWMCVAQHHRLPTYLIDWSLNPMISLYFAVESYENSNCDGRFWYMRLRPKSERQDLTFYVDTKPDAYETEDSHNLGGAQTATLLDGKKIPDRGAFLVVPRILTRRIDALRWPTFFRQRISLI